MKRQKTQSGVAAIEFAIVLMPMIMIVFGITEFGRAIYQYNTVAKATRDAARYLTTQPTGDANAIAAAECLVRYGKYGFCVNNTGSTPPLLAPGLDPNLASPATISVCHSLNCPANQSQGSNPVINMVTVTVGNYRFQSLVPFVTAGLATITYDDISNTMRTQL